MKNYVFESNTRIYFGKDEENKVGEYINSYGFKSVLLVYGKNSAKKSGLYDLVVNSLNKYNIKVLELSGIKPNPSLEDVINGLSLIKKEPVDMILALGGGSVIDTCKLISNGYFYDGNPFDFNEYKAVPTKNIPLGVILTIPAAGSELSTSCVITDESRNLKRGFNSQTNRPLFVIENPDLMLGLPFNQIAYGITDILAHSMERYFSISEENEFVDYLALGLMKSVVDAGYDILKDQTSYSARKTLYLASSYSHNGLTSICKDISMPVHQLEHELSGLHNNIAHGEGLAILFPYWMKETYEYAPKKFAKFGEVLFNIKDDDIFNASIRTIEAYQEFLKKFNLPTSLKDVGVSLDDIEIMAKAFENRVIPGYKPLDNMLAKKIFIRAWKGE